MALWLARAAELVTRSTRLAPYYQSVLSRAADGEWITVPMASRLLGLGPTTVYRLVDEGELAAEVSTRTVQTRKGRVGAQHGVDQRTVLIHRQAVADYIERARVTPGTLRHLYQGLTGGRYR